MNWLSKTLIEVVLIGIAVFLGMAADQWRSDRQHRDQARTALARFKTEMEANKAAVTAVRDYHQLLQRDIKAYLDAPVSARGNMNLRITRGIGPVTFEHSAWDLALATQALADIDSALGFELARVYAAQQTYTGLTTGLINAMYHRPPTENLLGFLHSVRVWLDDIASSDPILLKEYDRVLPLIDAALRD